MTITAFEYQLMNARNADHRQFERDYADQEANHQRQMRLQQVRQQLSESKLERKILHQQIEAGMRAKMEEVIDQIRAKGTKVPDDYFLQLRGFVEADLLELGIEPMQYIPGALAAFRKFEQAHKAKNPPPKVLSQEEKDAEEYARMHDVKIDEKQRTSIAALLAKANRTRDPNQHKLLGDQVMDILTPGWREEQRQHDERMKASFTERRDRHAKGEKLEGYADSLFLAGIAVYSKKEQMEKFMPYIAPLLSWKEKLVLKMTGKMPVWTGI